VRCPTQSGLDSRQPPIPIDVALPSPSKNSHLQANASGGAHKTSTLLVLALFFQSRRDSVLGGAALEGPPLLPGPTARMPTPRPDSRPSRGSRRQPDGGANAFRFINLEEGRLCGSDREEQVRALVEAHGAVMPTEQDPDPSSPASTSSHTPQCEASAGPFSRMLGPDRASRDSGQNPQGSRLQSGARRHNVAGYS
jgi:hypothetical protein